jgi:acyl-CoA thioesterase
VAAPLLDFQETTDGHHRFELTPDLARFDGRLFGGAGLAASVAAMELVTERNALWVTVQFVGSAEIGNHIDCDTEVLAGGYNTSQCRVTATTEGRIVFVALGSTARARDGFGADLGSMPEVPGPDACASWAPNFPGVGDAITARGPFATAEIRQTESRAGTDYLWARMKDYAQTRQTLAYLGDFVPSAVLRAAGKIGGGTSLDNSIRFGAAPAADSDWILIDNEPYLADSGYVHGAARLWSADGHLLAVASQTAVARLFD